MFSTDNKRSVLIHIDLIIVLVMSVFFFRGAQAGEQSYKGNQQNRVFLPLIATGNGVKTIDDLFTTVAERAPGFGGTYVDEEADILYVYMRDGDPEAAVAALREVFGRDNLPNNVQVLQAEYGFLQLKQWHDLMAEYVFEIPGVVMTDINDTENRLLVGGETQEARDQVKSKLAELGIPETAANIVEAGPLRSLSSLTNLQRPLVGGLQFQDQGGGSCTLGFIAIRESVPGFVTNAHCSPTEGGVNHPLYYQPTLQGMQVYSTQDWQDTDVSVQQGDTLTIIYLSGLWSPWPGGYYDGRGVIDGEPCQVGQDCILFGVAHASLIGRIGDGDPFHIGNEIILSAQQSGNVFLRINDSQIGDNSDSLTVKVADNDIEDDYQVGEETVKAAFRSCISFIDNCRWSDSLFAKFQAAPSDPGEPPIEVLGNLGFIARPALNSVAWDGVSTFRITAEDSFASLIPGQAVTMVGRTSGRKEGRVLFTSVVILDDEKSLINQVFATYEAEKGDSGAPVISARSPDPNHNPVDTTLLGINWGDLGITWRDEPLPIIYSIFSPIYGVEADLGSLNTCAPPDEC